MRARELRHLDNPEYKDERFDELIAETLPWWSKDGIAAADIVTFRQVALAVEQKTLREVRDALRELHKRDEGWDIPVDETLAEIDKWFNKGGRFEVTDE